MSDTKQKKLTQTTLSFLIKPKTSKSDTPPAPAPVVKKRQRSAQESKDECTKKVKLDIKTKQPTGTPDALCEPEVSSSSEPVQVVPAVSVKPQSSLDPYIKLTRCPTPKIEVSSSTADEVIDISNDVSMHEDNSVVEQVVNTHELESEEVVHASNMTLTPSRSRHTSNNNADDGRQSSLSQGHNSSINSVEDATPNKALKPAKALSASAIKRKEEQRLAAEEKRRLREEEKEQKRLQKLQEKLEKEKALEEAKRIKAEQKEAERLAKLKEKEEKQKLKDELLAQKQAEIDAKNAIKEAEKKKKEEERLKKEEEKKQKELEKQRIEEEKVKKQEAQKNALLKFFHKPAKKDSPEKPDSTQEIIQTKFKPFSIKADMRLAPISRAQLIDKTMFDEALESQSTEHSVYLNEVKTRGARTQSSTWPWLDDDDEEDAIPHKKRHQVKFLQFHTDVRPAYFGTWRQKSQHIRPRCPLGQDKQKFDYDVDSADEWEEEEPGESVDSGEEDEEEKDEFDFDPELREDGFLVDHNYLSDGEGGVSDDDEESLAAKKTKQMIARTYGKRNRKKTKLKPMVYGTVWSGENNCDEDLNKRMLDQYTAIVFHTIPIEFVAPIKKASPETETNASSTKKGSSTVPTEALPELIKMLHGCMKSAGFIMKNFQDFWQEKTSELLSKRKLKTTIQSIASYTKKTLYRKPCWYVNEDVLTKHELSSLPVPHPMHKTATPIKTRVEDSNTNTPVNVKPSPKVNSSQKRLTDFVQPAKKKLKIDNVTMPQKRKVALITLTDSPDSSSNLSTKTDVSKSTADTPTSYTHIKTSPRRVSLTSVSTPTTKSVSSMVVPRRVGLTSMNTVSAPGDVVLKAASPRRVGLTTIGTPSNSAKPQSISTSPRRVGLTTITTSPKTSSLSTKDQLSKSPRRIQLTSVGANTLPEMKPLIKSSNTLTEQSQNTPKIDKSVPVKTGVL